MGSHPHFFYLVDEWAGFWFQIYLHNRGEWIAQTYINAMIRGGSLSLRFGNDNRGKVIWKEQNRWDWATLICTYILYSFSVSKTESNSSPELFLFPSRFLNTGMKSARVRLDGNGELQRAVAAGGIIFYSGKRGQWVSTDAWELGRCIVEQ